MSFNAGALAVLCVAHPSLLQTLRQMLLARTLPCKLLPRFVWDVNNTLRQQAIPELTPQQVSASEEFLEQLLHNFLVASYCVHPHLKKRIGGEYWKAHQEANCFFHDVQQQADAHCLPEKQERKQQAEVAVAALPLEHRVLVEGLTVAQIQQVLDLVDGQSVD